MNDRAHNRPNHFEPPRMIRVDECRHYHQARKLVHKAELAGVLLRKSLEVESGHDDDMRAAGAHRVRFTFGTEGQVIWLPIAEVSFF